MSVGSLLMLPGGGFAIYNIAKVCAWREIALGAVVVLFVVGIMLCLSGYLDGD